MSVSNQEQERLATGKPLLYQSMLGHYLTSDYGDYNKSERNPFE